MNEQDGAIKEDVTQGDGADLADSGQGGATSWGSRRLSRRTIIKSGAIGGAALFATLYVKPSFRAVGVAPAYAVGTQFTPEGCTPGLWKNHEFLWYGYDPGDIFDTVFGVSLFGASFTLLDALKQGGGGVNALGRHATAALLNAAQPDVGFVYSEAEIKSMVQQALIDGGDAIEATKNLFNQANESSCLLSAGKSLRAED